MAASAGRGEHTAPVKSCVSPACRNLCQPSFLVEAVLIRTCHISLNWQNEMIQDSSLGLSRNVWHTAEDSEGIGRFLGMLT